MIFLLKLTIIRIHKHVQKYYTTFKNLFINENSNIFNKKH